MHNFYFLMFGFRYLDVDILIFKILLAVKNNNVLFIRLLFVSLVHLFSEE